MKPVKSAIALMPTATHELPYEGAKEMILVDNIDDRGFLSNLIISIYDELSKPKNKGETFAEMLLAFDHLLLGA